MAVTTSYGLFQTGFYFTANVDTKNVREADITYLQNGDKRRVQHPPAA